MIYNLKLLSDVILITISFICVLRIIFDKRDPKGTLCWILFFILFKTLAIITFLLLGRNWRNRCFTNNVSIFLKDKFENYYSENKNREFNFLEKIIGKSNPYPVFTNNQSTFFTDGKSKYKALKEDLIKANHHIHLEYYIVRNDKIGNEIKDILIKKAQEGIKVRFIIDKIGSLTLSRKYTKQLEKFGIEVVPYAFYLAPFYRNHKKIVIIDGVIGYLGGMNLGDEYEGKGKLGFWRDLHIRIEGDFVFNLQRSFINDYFMINKGKKNPPFIEVEYNNYFPNVGSCSSLPMLAVESGPSSDNPSIMYSIINMISNAKKNIFIMTPYFIPSESLLISLKIAALRGIDVRILFPGKCDHFYVFYASRTYLSELMQSGVKVYLYRKDSFLHSKAISVDGKICNMGNANIDIRSFELNYELNAIIFDDNTVLELENIFHKECSESTLLYKDFFENSSIFIKLLENICRMFSNTM